MSCQCVTLASSPFAQFHQKRCKGLTAFVFTNLVPNLDSSGLCCIATEKIWWLLTKFIINNHLTVEEKICHRK
ncbi:hypothetical protein ACJZL1_02400 [Wolbachia endosymbiont of Rhagoletis indifferens]|uniref:hypothetical protein n=1 Tax=Wolbachia endosymbiont of Rhagoletis indifferens TaxID=3383250 RepID=UPI003AF34571